MKKILVTICGFCVLLSVCFWMAFICFAYKRTKINEDNLRDIDQRLTILEQSLNETDKAVIKALQGSNEALYELKLMEINGN